MARFSSDKPAKTVEDEAEVNHDDRNLETSINPLDSSTDSYPCPDSVSWLQRNGYVDVSIKDDNEFEKFDDQGMEMVQEEEAVNFISDWIISDESRSPEDESPVNVATLPIGDVLSVKGKQVIIEGKEKHYLLSKGSFLWITETRAPLGYVDEIFGNVKKKACYSVRIESENQVPEGISQGTQVSLIVADSVQHDKRSCGASSGDEIYEIEFSDDDKEAEHRKLQKKMTKMGITSEQKTGNTGNNKTVLDSGRYRNEGAEQTLLSSTSSPVMPQAIAGTLLSPNRSESQVSPVRIQAIAGSVGLVSQHQPLPRMGRFAGNPERWRPETNQQITYQQHPVASQMGLMPVPNPMVYYQEPQFRRRTKVFIEKNYTNQQPYGLHQPYPNAAPWPEMNSHPFPQPHPQMQQLQSQRLNAGPSSARGVKVHYRGGGSGFRRGIGRGQLPAAAA